MPAISCNGAAARAWVWVWVWAHSEVVIAARGRWATQKQVLALMDCD